MAWLYVPGQGDLSSELSWPSEMPIGLSLQWNGKPLQLRSWLRVSKMGVFRRFLSGIALSPLTADRGVAWWISSLAATRASRSRSPESAGALTTPGTSGLTSLGSSERFSQNGASLRTWQDTFGLDTSTLLSPTLNALVTELRRASSRRRTLARRTDGNGSSSLPRWATPRTGGRDGTEEHYDLDGQATNWPTPRSTDEHGPGEHGEGGADLRTAALWPTPATDSFRSRGGERKDEQGLDQQARLWATPTSRDWRAGANPTESVATNSLLGRQAPRIMKDGQESSESGQTSRRQLNVAFVEWLQGWTPGWTSLEPLDSGSQATESCRSRQSLP